MVAGVCHGFTNRTDTIILGIIYMSAEIAGFHRLDFGLFFMGLGPPRMTF